LLAATRGYLFKALHNETGLLSRHVRCWTGVT
jgi:hypothetical protein